MKDQIVSAIDQAAELEQLYRSNRKAFEQSFRQVFPQLQDKPLAQAWWYRLTKPDNSLSFGKQSEWVLLIFLSLLAWLVAKVPEFAGLSEDLYFTRNISFTILPFLSVWFFVQSRPKPAFVLASALIFVLSAVYINMLPANESSQTLHLANIHLVLFLWFITGISFAQDRFRSTATRLAWLRFNGDLAVMAAVLFIAGGILSVVTIGLFGSAGINIEKFYGKYIAIWGAVSIPLAGAWLVHNNPQLVGKVSPVVARIFIPLVVLMLGIYLLALPFSGKDPFHDRDFLLVFNLLLLGVMALIFFAIPGRDDQKDEKGQVVALLLLAVLTLIVNGIALSAILYRINEWGITPNRLAVLVSNILIFCNLILITLKIFKVVRHRALLAEAGQSIGIFLPLYAGWTAVVVFLFPLIFNFR
ncbi:MAG: DUF4153 domain-containing protein [Bacteroidetes bacterium]|nr:DUF4153 domain-containing protein [Bacteroidota bacterium]